MSVETPPQMAASRGSWLSSAMALFLVWTALMYLVRVWAKLRTKSWGLDDWTISGAFAIAVMHVAATYWAIQHGYGLPIDSISEPDLRQVETALYAGQYFYIVSTGLSKVSTALFIVHLSYSGPRIKPAYVLATISVVWTTVSMFVVAFRGNLSRPWATLDGTQPMFARWVGVEVPGLLLEVTLWLLAVNLVWGLQMTLRKRLVIIGAFGFRLFLIPLVAVRLLYLSPSKNLDPTFSSIVPNIITEAVLQFSIISASVTSLRPFLRSLHPGYTVDSTGTNRSGLRSGIRTGSQDPYYRLDVISKKGRSVISGSVTANEQSSEGLPAGNGIAYPGKSHNRNGDKRDIELGRSVSKGKLSSGMVSRSESEAGDMNDPDPLIIRKTTDWVIRYENEQK